MLPIIHMCASPAWSAAPRRCLAALLTIFGCADRGVAPATDLPATITFTVDATVTKPISRFIYGANFATDSSAWGGAAVPPEVTLNRVGGNRLSAYNWTNNYRTAGSEYLYSNDGLLSASRTPGEAIRVAAAATFARNAGFLATIPMLGYVSADGNGPMDVADSTRAQRLATRFKVSLPAKGAPFTLAPDPAAAVYQDEFVNWSESTFPTARTDPTRPLFYSLDNEPDGGHETHEEIMSKIGGVTPRLQTYDGFIATTIDYARAVKAVAPQAKVFGPAVATWAGMATLGRYPSPDPVYGTQFFLDVYLDKLRAAEGAAGRRILDVLDVHWYPAAGTSAGAITNDLATQSPAMIQARLQAPRSLWDPTYDERSWVSGAAGGPVRLIPRLREEIAAHYPGTEIAITEYFYGRGGDISGGIAQADVLGILGREGVFAATIWPLANVGAPPYGGDGARAYAYVFGALRMYLNYDGAGGRFGDTGLAASSSNPVSTSVYASREAGGRTIIVAINKTAATVGARVAVRGAGSFATAEVYTLTDRSSAPVRQPDQTVGGEAFVYQMPAMSVSTLVLQR
ncbi:MAG: glycoside hydrolase family 44 protein [Gemmatimonadaceae bacterium]